MTTLSHLKITENNYSVTAPGYQIFLCYDDAQSFETSIINNHSVTAPNTMSVLGDNYEN